MVFTFGPYSRAAVRLFGYTIGRLIVRHSVRLGKYVVYAKFSNRSNKRTDAQNAVVCKFAVSRIEGGEASAE